MLKRIASAHEKIADSKPVCRRVKGEMFGQICETRKKLILLSDKVDRLH